jgi:hypothetical protein
MELTIVLDEVVEDMEKKHLEQNKGSLLGDAAKVH